MRECMPYEEPICIPMFSDEDVNPRRVGRDDYCDEEAKCRPRCCLRIRVQFEVMFSGIMGGNDCFI